MILQNIKESYVRLFIKRHYSDSVHAFTPEDAVKMIVEKYSLENSNEEVTDLLENLEEMSE